MRVTFAAVFIIMYRTTNIIKKHLGVRVESGCAVLAFVKHKTCTTIAQQSYLNTAFSLLPCCTLQSKNWSQSRFPLQRNNSQSLANEV